MFKVPCEQSPLPKEFIVRTFQVPWEQLFHPKDLFSGHFMHLGSNSEGRNGVIHTPYEKRRQTG